jgi:GNAT superfamily N-acetyltransferase
MTDATAGLNFQNVRIVALPEGCRIDLFRCGVPSVDKWVKEKAVKHHAQNRAKVFCAFIGDGITVSGFYSLTLSWEDAGNVSGQYRDIYRITGIPLLYISWLGVLRSLQRQGLGSFLLIDALRRAYLISQHVPFYGVALRSLNDETGRLYERYGFQETDDGNLNPLMILPIWTVQDLFERT